MISTINPFLHTVSIQKCDGADRSFVGSGVLLQIDGIDYIVTAAHVIDDLPVETGIGIAIKKGNEIRGMADRPRRICPVKQQDGRYKDGVDLALLLATRNYREFVAEVGMSFFDLNKNDPPPATDVCFISGFPAKKNFFDSQAMIYAETCGCYHIQSFVKNSERVQTIGGNTENHFALETKKRGDFWDCQTNKKIPELFDLHGMSGGGVWHMPRGHGAQIPESATGLAGILIHDRDTKNDRQSLALVVKIEAIHNIINLTT